MKKIIWIVVAVAVLGGIFYATRKGGMVETGGGEYKNSTYMIEDEYVTLVNGEAEKEAAPGSASKIITKYFGNEVKADLNTDGMEDVVFILTQERGGSGTFYYLTGALKNAETDKEKYWGMSGVLLGDRIAPQTTEFKDGEVIVNFAVRKPGEDFSIPPSVNVSKHFKFLEGSLVPVPLR